MINKLSTNIYKKFFGREPGPIATNFLKNIGYVAVGVFLAKFLIMVFQLLTGRLLGAALYGKFTVIVTISEFMYIPMTIALTAMVKYLAEKKEHKDKILSTSIIITSILIIIFSTIYFLVMNPLASFLNVHPSYIGWAIILAIPFTIWVMTTKIAQALELMKRFSLIQVVRSLVLLLISSFLILYLGRDTRFPIIGYIIGYFIAALIIIPVILKIKFIFDKKWAKKLLKYGLIIFIGGTASITLKNIDKLFINSLLGLTSVGIYQAYSTATFGISIMFLAIFSTVFFPESSKRNKILIWSKIKVILKNSYILTLIIIIGSIPLIFLYGREYQFNISYILLFALGATMAFIHSTLSWYTISFGLKGARNGTIAIILAGSSNVVFNLVLIPLFQIPGAIIATILSYTFSIFYLGIISRRELLRSYV